MVIHYELTYDCPNSCCHCFNPKHRRNDNDYIINIAERIAKNDSINRVVLTGGEPLLVEKKTLKNVLDILKNKTISLNSTLIPLDNESVEILKDKITGVLVSVHGNEYIHNKVTQYDHSFEYTIKGIELARKNNIPVGINYVCRKDNISYVMETFDYLFNNFQINSFSGTPMMPNNTENLSLAINLFDLKTLLKILLKIRYTYKVNAKCLVSLPLCCVDDVFHYKSILISMCSAGDKVFSVSPDGMIGPCEMAYRKFGSILDNEDLLNKKIILEKKIPEICTECNYQNVCNAGCAASLELTKHPFYSSKENMGYLNNTYFTIEPELRIINICEDRFEIYCLNGMKTTVNKSMMYLILKLSDYDKFNINDVSKCINQSTKKSSKLIYKLITNNIIISIGG